MFTPTDLRATTDFTLEQTLTFLNSAFKKAADKGWFSEWFKDRIYVNVGHTSEPAGAGYYTAIVQYREEIIAAYKEVGWSNVTVQTSEENGERAGLVTVSLFK